MAQPIDIFNIKPTVVSRNLDGVSLLLYGSRKSGKTTNATKFPRHILLGFEKGYAAINGVMALPMNTWEDAVKVQKQLLKDVKAVEKGEKEQTTFQTIIVDTADLAFASCEQHILAINGVTSLDETENKCGYKQLERTFEKWFLDFIKANYTIIFISHSEDKQIKDPRTGEKVLMTIPTMEKRCAKTVMRAVDIIGYANSTYNSEGNTQVTLTMRGNPELEAGSRFKYQSTTIPFTYKALVDDITQAIDKQAQEDGIEAVGERVNLHAQDTPTATFEETMEKVKEYGMRFHKADKLQDFNAIAEKHLGVGAKLTQATRLQASAVAVALLDVEELAEELGI